MSAFKSCRRWLEGHGYLGLVEGGTTPLFRAAVLADPAEGNRCPLYVLATPRRRCQIRKPEPGPAVNRPLPRSRRDLGLAPRAREASPKVKRREGPRSARSARAAARCFCPASLPANPQRGPGGGRRGPGTFTLTSGGSPLSISATWPGCSSLRDGPGRTSCRRSTTSPAAASTATSPGVRSPARVGRVPAWPVARPGRHPLPSRSQLAAADRERVLAEQARRRAERRRAVRVRRGRGGRQGDAVGQAGRVARPGSGVCRSGVC